MRKALPLPSPDHATLRTSAGTRSSKEMHARASAVGAVVGNIVAGAGSGAIGESWAI